jgi:hypothetical protein
MAAALLGAVLSVASAAVIPGASFVLLLWTLAAELGALPPTVRLMRSRVRSRTDDQAVFPALVTFAALLPALVIFAAVLPLLRFLYPALGSLAWPVSTLVLGLGAATLLPLLAAASGRARQRVMATAALFAAGGAVLTLSLPTYSAEWPERINVEYWWDADTRQSHYLAQCNSLRLPAALAAAAHFDPVPRPRFAGSGSLAFYAAAPTLALAAPELRLTTPPTSASQPTAAPQPTPVAQATGAPRPTPASQAAGSATHYELRLRSLRGAPEALVVFPASALVANITLVTAAGPVRTPLSRLRNGATLLDIVSLPADGVKFSLDAAGQPPLMVQVLDQSYDLPEEGGALQRARPANATSSQDGDLTVVHRTATLYPAADR